MPVIVVGADTEIGGAIAAALVDIAAELRVFVTDPHAGESLRAMGAKVAVGDLSDAVSVGDASYRTFCAILLSEAATDARERSFAADPQKVVAAWTTALLQAGTHRAIWVGDTAIADLSALRSTIPEFAVVATESRPARDVVADALVLEGTGEFTGS